jgi:hypothetical protein
LSFSSSFHVNYFLKISFNLYSQFAFVLDVAIRKMETLAQTKSNGHFLGGPTVTSTPMRMDIAWLENIFFIRVLSPC